MVNYTGVSGGIPNNSLVSFSAFSYQFLKSYLQHQNHSKGRFLHTSSFTAKAQTMQCLHKNRKSLMKVVSSSHL